MAKKNELLKGKTTKKERRPYASAPIDLNDFIPVKKAKTYDVVTLDLNTKKEK